MGSVEYRIIAYAESEYVISGQTFLVIFRLEDVVGPALRAYLWDRWQTLTADADEVTDEYLHSFVHDIRRRLVRDVEAMYDTFFEAIETMNIGPFRTSASGRCSLEDLQILLPSVLDPAANIYYLSDDRMSSLIETLRRFRDQVQAART